VRYDVPQYPKKILWDIFNITNKRHDKGRKAATIQSQKKMTPEDKKKPQKHESRFAPAFVFL